MPVKDSCDQRIEVFSDASGAGGDRFHSIALVSGTQETCCALREALSNCPSVEWKQVNGDHKAQQAALQYVETLVSHVARGKIRVDIITWDRQDARHQVRGRDDAENRARMYYHGLVYVGRQYGSGLYALFPDEGECFDWDTLVECLERIDLARRRARGEVSSLPLFEIAKQRLTIEVQQCRSHEEPLVRLADIFAGMARWSREKAPHVVSWVDNTLRGEELSLFEIDEADTDQRQSRADVARTELVATLDRLCKDNKLGVSLRQRGYLWTPDPCRPINFWPYEPQHKDDKAPTRGAV